ncbi:c-type cytochrome [Acidomonas methanolica]|nr:hypothetical protein [Acidomonas methanolica]MBU2654750.1 hypothetical protein [Acidomonas methanolica]
MIRAAIGAGLLFLASSSAAVAIPARNQYLLKCSGCHLADGEGMPSQGIPNFIGQVGMFAGIPEGRVYIMHVPGVIGSSLSDREISTVLNYIMKNFAGQSFQAGSKLFTADEVARLRAENIGNVVEYRRKVANILASRGLTAPAYPWP